MQKFRTKISNARNIRNAVRRWNLTTRFDAFAIDVQQYYSSKFYYSKNSSCFFFFINLRSKRKYKIYLHPMVDEMVDRSYTMSDQSGIVIGFVRCLSKKERKGEGGRKSEKRSRFHEKRVADEARRPSGIVVVEIVDFPFRFNSAWLRGFHRAEGSQLPLPPLCLHTKADRSFFFAAHTIAKIPFLPGK